MRLLVLVGMALALGGSAEAQLTVETRSIKYDDGNRQIDIEYPHTGLAAIDNELEQIAKGRAATVDLKKPRDEDNPVSVTMGMRVFRNDDKMFGVDLPGNSYYGGAHPMPQSQSLTFLLPDGWRVDLADMVNGERGLKKISDLAIADIIRQRSAHKEKLSPSALKSIQSGAGPLALQTVRFEWLPNELILDFDPYEIGGYTDSGVAHIPLSALQDVIRSNPRAPQPSFDCAKASNAVEQAICSDIALARLDRELATRYAYRLQLLRPVLPATRERDIEYNQNRKAVRDALIANQRQWLKQRIVLCPGAETACLTKIFWERYKFIWDFDL